jgi:hypothetical protein
MQFICRTAQVMHIYCNIEALRLTVLHILSSSLYFCLSYDKKITFFSGPHYAFSRGIIKSKFLCKNKIFNIKYKCDILEILYEIFLSLRKQARRDHKFTSVHVQVTRHSSQILINTDVSVTDIPKIL